MNAFSFFCWFGLLLPVVGWAQEAPAAGAAAGPSTPTDSLVQAARYQRVVAVPGVSADELYARAREWAALTFEDVRQAVHLDDAPRHLLLGSGYTQAQARRPNGTLKNPVPLWFSFRLETRDGRYRVTLADLGSVREFPGGQYAAGGIAYWLAASQATRQASHRHSEPGQSLAALLGDSSPRAAKQVTDALDRAMNALLASLHEVETAAPAAW